MKKEWDKWNKGQIIPLRRLATALRSSPLERDRFRGVRSGWVSRAG